jgi:hypothetical protein
VAHTSVAPACHSLCPSQPGLLRTDPLTACFCSGPSSHKWMIDLMSSLSPILCFRNPIWLIPTRCRLRCFELVLRGSGALMARGVWRAWVVVLEQHCRLARPRRGAAQKARSTADETSACACHCRSAKCSTRTVQSSALNPPIKFAPQNTTDNEPLNQSEVSHMAHSQFPHC